MLAARMSKIEPSGIRRVFELMATMDDPINFSIGQAHYDPPPALIEAACRAIRDGHNRYTVTQGLPELNARILAGVEANNGRRPESCLVTSGVSGGILLAFLALLDPGDEILLPDPNFMMYRHLASLTGATIRYYDLYPRFHIDTGQLDELVTEKTKVIFLNSPGNPTGGVLGREEIAAVVAAASGSARSSSPTRSTTRSSTTRSAVSPVAGVRPRRATRWLRKTYGIPGWRLATRRARAHVLDAMKTSAAVLLRLSRRRRSSTRCWRPPSISTCGRVHRRLRAKRDRVVAELDPSCRAGAAGRLVVCVPADPGRGRREVVHGRLPGAQAARRARQRVLAAGDALPAVVRGRRRGASTRSPCAERRRGPVRVLTLGAPWPTAGAAGRMFSSDRRARAGTSASDDLRARRGVPDPLRLLRHADSYRAEPAFPVAMARIPAATKPGSSC